MAKGKKEVKNVAQKFLAVKKDKDEAKKEETKKKAVVPDLPEKPIDPNQTKLFDDKTDETTETAQPEKEPKGKLVKVGIAVTKDVALKIKLLGVWKGKKTTQLIVDLLEAEFEKMPDKDAKLNMAKTLGI